VLHAFVLVLLTIAVFVAGYGISVLIFTFTGEPPEILSSLIASLFGILILAVVLLLTRAIFVYYRGDRMDVGNEIIAALERISRGDFNVLIREEQGPYTELAESVNKMAKELGTMETLRQEFISSVSHEIQSPLTSIGGFAELIRQGNISDQDKDHYLDIIGIESKRLSKLSENLLKLSALEIDGAVLSLHEFRLDQQIENAVLMLEPQWASKQLLLSVALEPVTIAADEELLSQVWINLIHNALKFTPENGAIEIELSASDGYALCRIKDNGAGIPLESLPHIFERFYRADKARNRSVGGNGLGLSLVKKIVELHGGSVEVASEFGKGSSFSVRLPGSSLPGQK
jgi:signal transduction histidine kinase